MNTVKPFDPLGFAHVELGATKLNKLVTEHNGRMIAPGGKGIRVSQNGPGVTISLVRPRIVNKKGICSFGAIFSVPNSSPVEQQITGGLVVCGDKNFNVDPYTVDNSTPGDYLIQIQLSGIVIPTDDDVEIILPGVSSASGTPTFQMVSAASGYSDNVNPSTPGDDGTIYLPIGAVTIADSGTITFSPLGCGNFTVGQCAGILSYTRA